MRASFTLLVPPAVVDEIAAEPAFDYAGLVAEHFTVREGISPPDFLTELATLSAFLDMGELAVILLTAETNGMAVIDERAGRRAARGLGLDVIGSLGLLQVGIKRAWINDADALAAVGLLHRNGFRCPSLGTARTLAEYFGRIT